MLLDGVDHAIIGNAKAAIKQPSEKV
jgi:hypothetical protein